MNSIFTQNIKEIRQKSTKKLKILKFIQKKHKKNKKTQKKLAKNLSILNNSVFLAFSALNSTTTTQK